LACICFPFEAFQFLKTVVLDFDYGALFVVNLINMNLVKKRVYYFLDKREWAYKKNYYRGFISHEKVRGAGKDISLKKLRKLVSKYLDKGEIPDFIDTSLKKLFWEKASRNMKMAVIFSYHKRVVEKSKKVINVETDDWLTLDFFREYYEELRKGRSFKNMFRIFKIFRSFIATTGRHKKTLRFENIHLAEDVVQNKKVPSVHWDIYHPTRLFPINWVRHLLFEDIFS
jgi:hypothetical protein